jgi:hypothetical protein
MERRCHKHDTPRDAADYQLTKAAGGSASEWTGYIERRTERSQTAPVAGATATQAEIEAIRVQLGLDRPLAAPVSPPLDSNVMTS